MRFISLLIMMALFLVEGVSAQQGAPNLTSRRQPIQIVTSAVFQQYSEGDITMKEFSLPLYVLAPISRKMNVSLYASQAFASTDTTGSVSGLSDVQVSMSFVQQIGGSSLVLNMGANLPVGKQNLNADEFDTTVLIGRNAYDFRVPGFGRGLSLSPGLTWALPLSESLVVGLGASYLYKGSFEPANFLEDAYTPGNEILFTAGLDLRLSRTSALSGDVTYTTYGIDKVGDLEVFEAGDKITALLQYRSFLGFNEVRVVTRYRSRAKSIAVLTGEEDNNDPTQFSLMGSYRLRVNRSFAARILGEAHFYNETALSGARQVFDLGVQPDYRLTPTLGLTGQAVVTFGSVTGFEIGGGLVFRL